MAKKKEITPIINENIEHESLDSIMGERFGIYAKYVIQDRAIPDARDGLKPVQRRIIYSMYLNGNTSEKPTRKCAKIVGDVMGKLHPHGDSSIYGALVRMSQDWVMNMPLIDFQGNNGSIDNDGPAAYRYTEARLSKFANNLISDLNKDTVEMTLNYDDSEEEPVVLPSRYPNLYVNGSEGIAVAIATEIPPHNLKEIIEATIYRIKNPHCSCDDLLNIVKGPDFPTGGYIYESEGLKDIYRTGRGKIEIASKVEIIEGKDTNTLLITEIPYKVVKKDLVYSIAKLSKSKDIDGIIEVNDNTAGDGINITVELKKEVNPEIVLTYLYNKTQLKVNYSANVVAISHDRPKTLTLTSYLDTYIEHQVDVITRRSKFLLNNAKNRLHIVEGLIKAIDIIDEVVHTIRHSKDKKDAKENLKTKYGFSEEQSEAIVMMPLYRLTNTDINTYINERDSLKKQIKDLEEILQNDKKLKSIIIKDLKEISDTYGIPRRTIIKEKEEEITLDKRDLVAKEDVYVALTKEGYIKRSSFKSYKSSNGSLPGIKEGDTLIMEDIANTIDYILAFTNKGNYLLIPVHEIQEGKRKDEGKHINYLVTLPIDEYIIKAIVIKDFDKDVSIVMISKNNYVKKTKLKDFFTTRCTKPITCMKISKDDEMVDVSVSNGNSNLFITTSIGISTLFNENEIDNIGLRSLGVKAVSTTKNSKLISLITFRNDEKNKFLFITDKGAVRIIDPSKYEITKRLGKTQRAFESFKSDQHYLVYSTKILNSKDPLKLQLLMSDNSIIEAEISDFKLTPEKNCKNNLEIPTNLKISNVYIHEVQKIDKDTIVEEAKTPIDNSNDSGNVNNINSSQDTKEEDFKDYEQISIFDEMGD